MMVNLTPTLLVVLLNIHFLVQSAESVLNESRRLRTNDTRTNGNQLFFSPSDKYIRTHFPESLAFKDPPKISHPSISLQSISSNLFMQLVAGTNTSGYSGDYGPATAAQLRGVIPFVDSTGNIYIPEYGNHRIRKINQAGIITTFGGTGTSSTAGTSGPIGSVNLYLPWSIVGDSVGTFLYISDEYYVWKYLFSTGIVSVNAGTSTNGFSGDSGPATSAQLSLPTGLWLTTADVLYIADLQNQRIRKVSSGIITTVAGSGCTNNCVGSYAGDNGPATTATLYYPVGNYMDTSGKLYIADYHNLRIRLVDTNNIITTFAGSGSVPFNGDNIQALSANLNYPYDVKGDSLGNIYIADDGNCIIRMVDATGIISTVFGTPGSCGFSSGISSRTSVINSAYGIWLDSLSNIYFSDYNSVHRSIVVSQPSGQPTRKPSTQPTAQPTSRPSAQPSSQPSLQPTRQPASYISGTLNQGLIAYYPFDGNARDQSGNGNNGEVHTATLTSDRFGNPNSAFAFDGLTSYIEVPAGIRIHFVHNMSLSFWVNPSTSQVSSARIIDNIYGWGVVQTGSTVLDYVFYYFYSSASALLSGSVHLNSDAWTHVAITKASNRIRLYLNGDLMIDQVHAISEMYSKDLPIIIGAEKGYPVGTVSQHFKGVIDEIFLFNRSLTAREIVQLQQFDSPTSQPTSEPTFQPTTQPTTQPTSYISGTLTHGLVAYYPFDGNARDQSGNGNHGEVHNAMLTSDRFGNANSAYSFDGSSAYIRVDSGLPFDFSNNFSVALWVKPATSQQGSAAIFSKSHVVTQSPWAIQQSGSSLNSFLLYYKQSVSDTWTGSAITGLLANQWNHYSITKENTKLSSYLNGNLVATAFGTYPAIKTNGNLPLFIGVVDIATGCYFSGLLDEILIFNRTLTAQEVLTLYQFDAPTSQPSGHPSSNPTGQPSRYPSDQPTDQPSIQPTSKPSSQPTGQPTQQPLARPTGQPTQQPSSQPSTQPSKQPSTQPATRPSCHPSSQPTVQPTNPPSSQPTEQPSNPPSSQPSLLPSTHPTNEPSSQPTIPPSSQPTRQPTSLPSSQPTSQPSHQPTNQPSLQPTMQPLSQPSTRPSIQPTVQPSSLPSAQPSSHPTHQPSSQPTRRPTVQPSIRPSSQPSTQPSRQPSLQPTSQPTIQPSQQPTSQPSLQPTRQPSSQPSLQPSSQPTCHPTAQPGQTPTSQPSCQPSSQPSTQPTMQPTRRPSSQPSSQPSCNPTGQPTSQPTIQPSSQPTSLPSAQPSESPTAQPTSLPSCQPSNIPTSVPSCQPTNYPSSFPSSQPTYVPSPFPSSQPSNQPTAYPSDFPTSQPSGLPTSQPTVIPTTLPTDQPTLAPSNQPTTVPSGQPSSCPTSQPSSFPSNQPTSNPSSVPTMQPTRFPSSQPSKKPSGQPSLVPSSQPTVNPIMQPSGQPSRQPSSCPSSQSSSWPTGQPTLVPSSQPTDQPTRRPSFPSSQPSTLSTSFPSNQPTCCPSCQPSSIPTGQPSEMPSNQPTSLPSNQPSSLPTSLPSTQPSNFPSIQPISTPTSDPTSQPTMLPTAQPFGYPTSAPTVTFYQTNGVLFWLGTASSSYETQINDNSVLGTSFILFGRKFSHRLRFPFSISLSSSSSHEFVCEISKNEGGIRNDVTTRSTTIIGDINGDGCLDFLVGYPLASKCLVYLGNGKSDISSIITTTGESFAIVGDPYQGGGFLGWSSIRIGDLNGDGLDEIIVSAINANTVYVIYGKREFIQKNIYVNELQAKDGFKIIGHPDDINFGVSLTLLHDFRKGSRADLAITAQKTSAGQNIIYILFGAMLFKNNEDIHIDQIMTNSSDCFKIITPAFSYAGFSVAGIGDINSDGFDDLAIGSVPYSRGRYTEQITYIIYGRLISANSINELQLSEMTENDGFTVTGGGFLVVGVDDVNGDGIPDVMISSYEQWQGKGNSYIMVYPRNVTSSPTFLPSSQPTSVPSYPPSSFPSFRVHDPTNTPTIIETTYQPSHYGTFPPHLQRTEKPSLAAKTSRPTRIPSMKPSTRFPTAKTNTRSVSPTRKPTKNPTRMPIMLSSTTLPSRTPTERNVPSIYPTSTPSVTPTVSLSTVFHEITIDRGGVYNVPSGKANFIISGEGEFEITGNGGGKKIYTILPSKNVITITDFNKGYDQISLTHFLYLYSINDLVYRTNPLQFILSTEQKLILSSLGASDLEEDNFIFQKNYENKKKHFELTLSTMISLGILIGCIGLFGCVTKLNQKDGDGDLYPSKVKLNENHSPETDLIPENEKELNVNLFSDSGSLLFSSSDSEEDDDNELSFTDSTIRNEEERDLYENDNDWSLFSTLEHFFSRDNDEEINDDSVMSSTDVEECSCDPYIDDMFNASDAEEKQEDSDDEFDDDGVDIEGNYHESDDDVEGDISFIQQLFKNKQQH
jgi:hypothetical protein